MRSYQELLSEVLKYGVPHEDRTGMGTVSVFGRQWRHNMAHGFPLLTTKKVPLRWIFEELMWFLRGDTNEKNLRAKGVDIWKEWATAEQCAKFGREEGDLGPVYGALWRNFGATGDRPGVDQIARLIDQINGTPNSRRLLVSGWDPHNCDKVALPPCHTVYQVKVIGDRFLSLHLYARSIDAFLGLPFNIASYALLTMMLAKATRLLPLELIISFGDLHIYTNHIDQVNTQMARDPFDLCEVEIDIPWGSGLNGILGCQWNNVIVEGYRHHPKIEGEVAV